MILSAARSNELTIDKPTLETAVGLVNIMETQMPQVFRHLNTIIPQEKSNNVIEQVRARGSIAKSALYRLFYHTMTWKDFEESLTSGINAGYLVQVQREGKGLFIEACVGSQPLPGSFDKSLRNDGQSEDPST
jgi:hypothetical protein